MTTRLPEAFEAKLERLVREHLAEQQAAARAAIERAFATVTPAPRPSKRQGAKYTRRASSEVAGLAERVLELVQGTPGTTMAPIAARLGMKARALHRPMKHLKDAGRVRSAGQRHMTRYFPMVGAKAG